MTISSEIREVTGDAKRAAQGILGWLLKIALVVLVLGTIAGSVIGWKLNSMSNEVLQSAQSQIPKDHGNAVLARIDREPFTDRDRLHIAARLYLVTANMSIVAVCDAPQYVITGESFRCVDNDKSWWGSTARSLQSRKEGMRLVNEEMDLIEANLKLANNCQSPRHVIVGKYFRCDY